MKMFFNKSARTTKCLHRKRKNLDPYLTPYPTINSGWIININLKAKTIKLLDTLMRKYLCKVRVGNNYLDKTQKILTTNKNINRVGGCSSVLEWLSSMHEALGSNSSTKYKKQNKNSDKVDLINFFNN
jgi:hypothetical protein